MFSQNGMSKLLASNKRTLGDLVKLEGELNSRFAEMEEAVRCLILAVASGEPMLLIGPPGTAKSRLIRVFCNLLEVVDDESISRNVSTDGSNGPELREIDRNSGYFTYLLTQFTEPSELFGYFDIGKLVNDPHELVKLDQHAMQRARVVFLDEVFNASSAILNTLLTFMNEREIHDRGKIYGVPMQCLFSATNHVPEAGELSAVYDRFLLRCWIDNESAEPLRMQKLLSMGWSETHAPVLSSSGKEKASTYPTLLDGVAQLQSEIETLSRSGDLKIETDSPLFADLADYIQQVREADLSDGSNRRLIKFALVMLINRLLEYARNGQFKVKSPGLQREDLGVFLRFGLDRRDDGTVRRFYKETDSTR